METLEVTQTKVDEDGLTWEAASVKETQHSLGGHPPWLVDDHKNEYKIETSI